MEIDASAKGVYVAVAGGRDSMHGKAAAQVGTVGLALREHDMKIRAALVIDCEGNSALVGATRRDEDADEFTDDDSLIAEAETICPWRTVQSRIVEIEIPDALLQPIQATAKEVQ